MHGLAGRTRVLVVFGTRPEAIKLAPVIRALRSWPGTFACHVCLTGQHREMLQDILPQLELKVDRDLALMKSDQSLAGLAAAALTGVSEVIASWQPDVVVVQGDTSTAFIAALAGFYAGVPVAHVEAGLRTGRLDSPFPEEGNRQLIARLAQWHFAPTHRSLENLRAEGVPEGGIRVTGNTGIDSLLWMQAQLEAGEGPAAAAVRTLQADLPFDADATPFVLVTGHRRENFGRGMRNICRALAKLARQRPDMHFVYPVHLNPHVQDPVRQRLGGFANIHLIPPVHYAGLVWLLDRARLVLTDSGGLQEEAPSLGKPVLVMRDTTERPEAVDAGTARLVGTDPWRIEQEVGRLLGDPAAYELMARAHNPFGDGTAAERIVATLGRELAVARDAA